ncbi:MAG: PA14 domain-containing protein [Limisphaerales bacterium]
MHRTFAFLALLVATVSASAQGDGKTGLLGQYFKNMTLTGPPALKRVDAQVNFDWAEAPAENFPADQFSVRWSGIVQAPATGRFTFITESDDGLRLWVDGRLLIDNWTDHGPTEDKSPEFMLQDGKLYEIIMEFYENGGGAAAKLLWSGPSTLKQPIPSFRLTPKELAPPGELDVAKLPPDTRGVVGHYFKGRDFAGKPVLRLDKEIAFDWGEGGPGLRAGDADDFCVRWTGQVKAEKTGLHTFFTETDDGVRLWVNGQKLVDQWVDQGATEHKGELMLEAGKSYDLVMEYYENSGFASAKLSWSVAGAEKKLIPSSSFIPKVITDKSQKR